jgi:hypothetical protein
MEVITDVRSFIPFTQDEYVAHSEMFLRPIWECLQGFLSISRDAVGWGALVEIPTIHSGSIMTAGSKWVLLDVNEGVQRYCAYNRVKYLRLDCAPFDRPSIVWDSRLKLMDTLSVVCPPPYIWVMQVLVSSVTEYRIGIRSKVFLSGNLLWGHNSC